MPRTPICPPTVGMDGHTLYFETDHPSFTLVLLDEEGDRLIVDGGVITNADIQLQNGS